MECVVIVLFMVGWVFFFVQAEDGIRDLVRSRGLGDVYKRQRQLRVNNGACRIGPDLHVERAARGVQGLEGVSDLSLIHI